MAISGVTDYTNTYAGYTNSANSKEQVTERTGSAKETAARKTASEVLSYLTDKYECLKSSNYSVNINSSLLAQAAGDKKTSEWLEYNLSLIPKVFENMKATVAASGAKLISCSITMNGYDSMSTMVVAQDEVDPGTEKAKKELEEKNKERRAEKKEQEEKAAKRREEKRAEEKAAERRAERKELAEGRAAGRFTVSAAGTDAKSAAQNLIAAVSGASVPAEVSFDRKA
ncbi:MAG: hypothetical protein K2O06_02750 [Acetatifactor sp.]|nr:hypothetical protein [Acetatifactor sp.]